MSEGSGFQVGERAPAHYQAQVERLMAPFVDSLIAAGVSRGDAVLDVACGTGFATRAAAEAVGSSGRVIGSDLNPGMVAIARSVLGGDGCEISWREASALDLPFDDDEFDAVVCQQGIQFFPDVPAGLREMARVARGGGRLVATVWAPIEESPFFAAETEMFVRYCGSDPAASSTAFLAEGEAEIRGWFEAAGFGSVSIELVEAVVSLPPAVEYVPEHMQALPWSDPFFQLTDRARSEAARFVGQRLAEYQTRDGLDVPFRSYLATTTASD